MQTKRVVAALAVTVGVSAVAGPGSAGAAPSCVGQAASAPTAYPTEKADFVTFFAGPGYGQNVSTYAQLDRTACPPLPTPGG
jgi:hypothetical protein